MQREVFFECLCTSLITYFNKTNCPTSKALLVCKVAALNTQVRGLCLYINFNEPVIFRIYDMLTFPVGSKVEQDAKGLMDPFNVSFSK